MGYDQYGRFSTADAGSAVPGAMPAAGLQPGIPFVVKVPFVAGAGTSLDVQVTAPQKLRIIDAQTKTVTGVASSTMQVFTAAAGGGSAGTSAMTTAAAGVTRDALTTATLVFASAAIIYCRLSGGATLPGGELYLTCLPEQ